MSIQDILRHRIGIPGPKGHTVDAGDWTSVLNRLEALESRQLRGAIASGLYYGPLTTLSGYGTPPTTTLSANGLFAAPFLVPEDAAFDQMSVWVNTAAPLGATMRVGLYAAGPDGLPATLVHELGTISSSATGHRAVAVTVALPRGLYWLAFAPNQAVGIRSYTGTGGQALVGHQAPDGSWPTSFLIRSGGLSSGFMSLPATFGTSTAGTTTAPVIWLRAA